MQLSKKLGVLLLEMVHLCTDLRFRVEGLSIEVEGGGLKFK